jgi:hypothetical protein
MLHRMIFISPALLLFIWLIFAGMASSIYLYLLGAFLILADVIYTYKSDY